MYFLKGRMKFPKLSYNKVLCLNSLSGTERCISGITWQYLSFPNAEAANSTDAPYENIYSECGETASATLTGTRACHSI